MTDDHSGTPLNDVAPVESPETLTARVLARVNNARRAVDRRANATRPRSRRRRPSPPASHTSPNSEEILGSQALRRVFHDFGISYRRNRSQTGGRVTPGLRDASYYFRANPSLTSLVAVAAFLDELDLLS